MTHLKAIWTDLQTIRYLASQLRRYDGAGYLESYRAARRWIILNNTPYHARTDVEHAVYDKLYEAFQECAFRRSGLTREEWGSLPF